MPSLNIHLAIAKRYTEKNKLPSSPNFYRGAIEPDLTKDKAKTHYSKPNSTDAKDKVNLQEFLSHHNLNNDFNRGMFLHLLSDYEFFNGFFDAEMLRTTPPLTFTANLYHSYKMLTAHLIEKYNLDTIFPLIDKKRYDENLKSAMQQLIYPHKKSIISPAQIDAFIEKISDLNLDDVAARFTSPSKNI